MVVSWIPAPGRPVSLRSPAAVKASSTKGLILQYFCRPRAVLESGWLPKKRGLSLAILRASPASIQKCRRRPRDFNGLADRTPAGPLGGPQKPAGRPLRNRGEPFPNALSPSCPTDSPDLLHVSNTKVLQHIGVAQTFSRVAILVSASCHRRHAVVRSTPNSPLICFQSTRAARDQTSLRSGPSIQSTQSKVCSSRVIAAADGQTRIGWAGCRPMATGWRSASW